MYRHFRSSFHKHIKMELYDKTTNWGTGRIFKCRKDRYYKPYFFCIKVYLPVPPCTLNSVHNFGRANMNERSCCKSPVISTRLHKDVNQRGALGQQLWSEGKVQTFQKTLIVKLSVFFFLN